MRVRFRLLTDDAITDNGVWLDDIRICSSGKPVTLLTETVEGAAKFTGDTPWAATTEMEAPSPTHSYTDSPGANYADNADVSLTSNTSPALTNLLPMLTFNLWLGVEYRFDYFFVEVSPDDGITWQRRLALTGSPLAGPFKVWSAQRVPLGRHLGQNVKVRFRLVSDDSVNFEGAFVDDIRIQGEALSPYAPAAPGNLAGIALSDTQVQLTWNDGSLNETAFRIERKLSAEPLSAYHEIHSVTGLPGTGMLTYVDGGLTANTFYNYRVRATSGIVVSPYSNSIAVRPLPIPAAPSGLAATATGATSVNLTWSDNSTNESGSYLERKKPSDASWARIKTLGVNATSTNDATVTTGQSYSYRLRAFNGTAASGIVTSAYSNIAGPVTPVDPPAAPTSLSASVLSATQVKLTWKDNAANETATYLERRIGTGGAWGVIKQMGATATTGQAAYTDGTVSHGVTYFYRVRAARGSVFSAYAGSGSVTP